jgi:hypothetical protein
MAEAGIGTYLAYALQNTNRVLEVADMKYGDHQLDVCVVANTINGRQPASLAECVLLRRSLDNPGEPSESTEEQRFHVQAACQGRHFSQVRGPLQYRGRDG